MLALEARPAACDGEEKSTVEVQDNHIYFYSEVTPERVLELIMALREVDTSLRQQQIIYGPHQPPLPIWLHIHSRGGDAFAAFSAADQIAQIVSPVYSVVEGYCASAATLISLSCRRRYIQPNAFFLIHQPSHVMWGKYQDFKDHIKMADMLMERIVSFYAGRSKMSKKKVRKLLGRESWFDAGRCLELGLADEIVRGQ